MSEELSLEQQISKRKKTIHADSYPMSIGEVINMYNDEELDIRPEFQRFYRWTLEQKTKLIESIFLGIPIPSFFVSQRDDGIWEVVDGLQRLSTIFEFVGILKDKNATTLDELVLSSAKYLPALDGKKWSDMSKDLKLQFKREKIDFKIIKKESTSDTKYEIFQRLNTGGNTLSDQEVRNCMLLMTNANFYAWLEQLGEDGSFKNCTILSEKQSTERYDLELVTRFLVVYNYLYEYKGTDLKSFLDEQIIKLSQATEDDLTKQRRMFLKTFQLLESVLDEDVFKKYVQAENRHKGAFSLSLFEFVTYGVAQNIDNIDLTDESKKASLKKKIRELSSDSNFLKLSGSGTNASTRFRNLLPTAKDFFLDA